MAGYMTGLQGYVYEGEYKAKAPIASGLFATIDNDGEVILTTAATTLKMRVHKATTLWGKPAIEAVVVESGTDEVYFVENVEDLTGVKSLISPGSEHVAMAGEYVRMHRMLDGEMAIFQIDDSQVATLIAGVVITTDAKGKVAVAA
jgi:hypothetical protein